MAVVATSSVVVAAVSAAVAAAVVAAALLLGLLRSAQDEWRACIIVSRGVQPAVGKCLIMFENCWEHIDWSTAWPEVIYRFIDLVPSAGKAGHAS